MPILNPERTIPAITCSFEFVVTDRQDKLIMLKHSQEIRELVLTLNFRQLFIVTVFVSADGETVFLQDKAIKYNDYMASLSCRGDSAAGQNNGGQMHSKQNIVARFYEIPFRNILRKIVEYQIAEKRQKVHRQDYRDIIQ